MDANVKPIATANIEAGSLDFPGVFQEHYARIARVIGRIVRDPARAEELAVDVFWKLWMSQNAGGPGVGGWLYRTAIRMGLDELRRRRRREKYERLVMFFRAVPTPEELHSEHEEQHRVRRALASLKPRQAELLLLQGEGLTYQELAQVLQLNPSSIGTLLRRAEQAFRKEYMKRYGQE